MVVSKHFSLPYVQLSPTFTIICPELILYYNTDTTHFTPSSTRLLNHILCHRSQQTLISHRKFYCKPYSFTWYNEAVNPLNPELNPICYLLALLAHHFLHVSRIRVKSLTLRLLVSYVYGAPILDISRSHTTTQHSR